MDPNFIKFHKSLADELKANKDQIRYLIGDAHWPSDGWHKEAILRRILQNKLPDTFRVGTGFFSDTYEPSSQIDILITDGNSPTLFRNGDFLIVTPECIKAIIEVKTDLKSPAKVSKALSNLAKNVERIRDHNPECWAGLFVYEGPHNKDLEIMQQSKNYSKSTLKSLNKIVQNNQKKTINCISIGPDNFVRYWPQIPSDFSGRLFQPGWESYVFINDRHCNLSPAYFIGNLIVHLTSLQDSCARRAWYPIQDGNGKEDYCLDFFELGHDRINSHKQAT